jgi:hypothetical protein
MVGRPVYDGCTRALRPLHVEAHVEDKLPDTYLSRV